MNTLVLIKQYAPVVVLVGLVIYYILDDKKKKSNRTPYNSSSFVIYDSPAYKARERLVDAWNKLPKHRREYVKNWSIGATINNDLKTGNYAGKTNFRTKYIYDSSINWLASVFVHEAAHNYITHKRGDLAGDRTAIEKEANRIQADVLLELGEPAMAKALLKADGTHWQNHNY